MKKILLLITGMLCIVYSLYAQQPQTIKGIVRSAKSNKPLQGVSLVLEKSQANSISDAQGSFTITQSVYPDTLVVSYIGFSVQYIPINETNSGSLSIQLEPAATSLKEVVVSTGYQKIPKERATGSFDFIDNELIDRSVSSNILDRIENLTPGLLFNHGDAAKTDKFLIRGRSTIYANAQPLIILNNFPYDGDINNINPNDVENITILKDAAAASIWGARAGNGVIVITTKKGKTEKPRIEVTSNITIQQKPDIFNVSSIPSPDYIDLEQYLFSKGYYNSAETSINHTPLTPVVELLIADRDGLISTSDANTQIEDLKKYNVFNDISKYLYRKSINQQYALNISGKTNKINYYLSTGYDKNLPSLKGITYSRVTIHSQNSFKIEDNLRLDVDINYFQSINASGNNPGYGYTSVSAHGYYPYAQLADADGNALPVYTNYRESFIKDAEQAGLLNWDYKPIEEIGNEVNTIKTRDYLLNTGLNYTIIPGLEIGLKYQYENQLINGKDLYKKNSFYARNMINSFTQVDPGTGVLSFPIPKGGILKATNNELTSHQARMQVNMAHKWSHRHQINALAGIEIKSAVITSNNNQYYGYNKEHGTVASQINFDIPYKSYVNSSLRMINNAILISKHVDHFLSYYANASYTYNHRYTFSASGRIDEANLFGVATNQKGTPLWSVGGSWLLSNEKFYSLSWIPYLKLRTTYGYNGNISRKASAYNTILYLGVSGNTGENTAQILNPANKHLKWERVGVTNLGLDFEMKDHIISGSIEYFIKNAQYLMGEAPIDPTLGVGATVNPSLFRNVASMKGHGIEVNINTININRKLRWQTSFIYTHNTSKVSKYFVPISATGANYIFGQLINPVIGRPLYSIYSYKWAGLDPKNGDPLGYLSGNISNDWNSIYYNTPIDSMVYNGPIQPTTYGAIRNTFSYKGFSLSFNISYKLGNYFRTRSVYYSNLFSSWGGNGDYTNRWKKPGDEKITNIPSLVYPANSTRDKFYSQSSILVEKGGCIRLEDVNISYDFSKILPYNFLFKKARLFIYASNLAVLWVANEKKIDPYFNNVPKERMSVSVGANFSF